MLRPVALALLASLAGVASADTPLWIARPEAQPWLPAIARAAAKTDLPPALIAELIGIESGFRNVKNPRSTASGFGQQIDGNRIMWTYGLDKRVPAESILGAAIELKARMIATGSLNQALKGYGTTAAMSTTRRHAIEVRFAIAAAAPAHVPNVPTQVAIIGIEPFKKRDLTTTGPLEAKRDRRS